MRTTPVKTEIEGEEAVPINKQMIKPVGSIDTTTLIIIVAGGVVGLALLIGIPLGIKRCKSKESQESIKKK